MPIPYRHASQEGWLGYERAEDITEAILDMDGTFTCHKTTHLRDSEQQHCAGALIMCEANDKPYTASLRERVFTSLLSSHIKVT